MFPDNLGGWHHRVSGFGGCPAISVAALAGRGAEEWAGRKRSGRRDWRDLVTGRDRGQSLRRRGAEPVPWAGPSASTLIPPAGCPPRPSCWPRCFTRLGPGPPRALRAASARTDAAPFPGASPSPSPSPSFSVSPPGGFPPARLLPARRQLLVTAPTQISHVCC